MYLQFAISIPILRYRYVCRSMPSPIGIQICFGPRVIVDIKVPVEVAQWISRYRMVKAHLSYAMLWLFPFAFRRTIGDGNGMSLTNRAGAAEAQSILPSPASSMGYRAEDLVESALRIKYF